MKLSVFFLISTLCLSACTESELDSSDTLQANPDALEDTVSTLDEGPVEPEGPFANVYLKSPLQGDGLTLVSLPDLTDPDGYLTGTNAIVRNCINEAGGPFILCNLKQTAQPGSDGSYLHIMPSTDSDPDDPFAEVMMYYHMVAAHDYFTDTLGMDPLTVPLLAVVNVQLNFFGGWQPFDNAAYMPKETLQQFQIDGIDEDAIVFGQGTAIDFSYDAAVIRHEYTHAMIGATRLSGTAYDEHGIDGASMAMHEAHADYFAATMSDDPVIGSYALQGVGGVDMSRDLSRFRSCPADMVGEVHVDGEMYGSALWAIREALGAELADRIIFDALLNFTPAMNFKNATEIVLARAQQEGPDVSSAITQAFAERGLLDCKRIKDYEDFTVTQSGQMPTFIEGTQSTGILAFSEFAPGYMQYKVDVPEGTKAIRVMVAVPEQQGFGFGGGGGVALDVVWRHDAPITYEFPSGGGAITQADAIMPLESTGNSFYEVVVSGSCLTPGTHYMQFQSRSQGQNQMHAMILGFLETDSGNGEYICPN